MEEKISRRFLDASYFAVSLGREDVILRAEKQNISSLRLVVGGGGASNVNEGVTERCKVLQGFERYSRREAMPIVTRRQGQTLLYGCVAE